MQGADSWICPRAITGIAAVREETSRARVLRLKRMTTST
jgi:hypothetical protein